MGVEWFEDVKDKDGALLWAFGVRGVERGDVLLKEKELLIFNKC